MRYNSCLCFWISFLSLCDLAFSLNDARSSSRMGCEIEQKGFHLKLKCSLTPDSRGVWDECFIDIDLNKNMYINPYEVSDRLPSVKFNISQKVSRETSWFSRKFLSAADVEKTSSEQEIELSASQIDVEAPEWRADKSRWKFFLNSQPTGSRSSDALFELDIPLHLRYSYPSPSGSPKSHKLRSPTLKCNENGESADCESEDLNILAPEGCTSDLILVMPLTVLFLTVGILAILIH